jgi:hypothetical protein
MHSDVVIHAQQAGAVVGEGELGERERGDKNEGNANWFLHF